VPVGVCVRVDTCVSVSVCVCVALRVGACACVCPCASRCVPASLLVRASVHGCLRARVIHGPCVRVRDHINLNTTCTGYVSGPWGQVPWGPYRLLGAGSASLYRASGVE
jgi:hypothetical protein